jgi:hypothetical protein
MLLSAWNGNIFWAPASKSANAITKFGDEARAVFGPIPDDDCRDGVAKTMGLEVDGNSVDLKPNTSKPGSPLEFEHRDKSGQFVKWTTAIPQCDKPSLAGGVTYCGLNSRLNRVVRGNVEWLAFCRKSKTKEVSTDPSWKASDPTFPLLGTIGFNTVSGEVVFLTVGRTTSPSIGAILSYHRAAKAMLTILAGLQQSSFTIQLLRSPAPPVTTI